uniref:Uncharacterized protein n=1 Tax=Magnetococcus massalia (strain MO-1) TaxID=451514 RepID=A0A1S7LC79_MAGMO|nr:Protein of unknown function [Candidatus Magnetococcus massalia]
MRTNSDGPDREMSEEKPCSHCQKLSDKIAWTGLCPDCMENVCPDCGGRKQRYHEPADRCCWDGCCHGVCETCKGSGVVET